MQWLNISIELEPMQQRIIRIERSSKGTFHLIHTCPGAGEYVDIAERVMKRLNDDGYNVGGYAYTKVADVAKDTEFDTTFSSGASRRET